MTKIPVDMKLTTMIQKWLDEADWNVDIEIDSEARTAKMSTLYEIDGETHRLFVEADERHRWLAVYMYGPIGIPAARYAEACKLVNGINCTIAIGRIAAIREENFQYKAVVDAEGWIPATNMLENMVQAGTAAFKKWSNAMEQLIFGGKSADQIFEDLENAHHQPGPGVDVLVCPGSLVPS